ncbi:MAG: hypothetical protein IPM21_05845 [Acidobacteria bacterium]|nr:hypothetical protein [Acidobacteriota bacterium]
MRIIRTTIKIEHRRETIISEVRPGEPHEREFTPQTRSGENDTACNSIDMTDISGGSEHVPNAVLQRTEIK